MISLTENAAPDKTAPQDLKGLVESIFAPDGLLSDARSFEYRPEQQRMATALMQVLLDRQSLVVEAGTGVGKSLAYLIPAILFATAHRKKAVVSTHTINLQEQLIQKDLPLLQKILPVSFSYTMLKGRQNYLCRRRLAKAREHAQSLFTSPEQQELERIWEWSQTTRDGSLSDFEVEPDPKVWLQVCSERGLCAPRLCGAQSEFGKESGPCFFQRARSRVLRSDVLVLNHTLFFSLLAAAEEELDGGILFKNDFVIFDEAHTLDQVASRHIGISLSRNQIRFAAHRLWNPSTQKGLFSFLSHQAGKELVDNLLGESDRFFDELETTCGKLARQRRGNKERGEARAGWSVLRIRRPEPVRDTLTLPLQRLREQISKLGKTLDDEETGRELADCNRRLVDMREQLATFLGQTEENHVYWVERTGKSKQNLCLNAAPINVADYLRRRLFGSGTTVVMTSATLSTAYRPTPLDARGALPKAQKADSEGPRRFPGLQYFVDRVGADSAQALQLGSPFDYPKQMRLVVVNKMPAPDASDYRDALVHWIEHFLQQTHGSAFVLFTNMKLMWEIAERMQAFLEAERMTCWVQGTGTPRSLMLQKFKEKVGSVLFGADSFWQGVDVPGPALSNVMITRLPFAVPDHPLTEARIEYIEAQGKNPFYEFSLPEAILKFRQGIGRLIRTKNDQGMVVVLDNRILTRRYGSAFLKAIPQCPVEVV